MTNMSYCRMEITFNDLLDAEDHLDDDDLSDSEKRYRDKIIERCKRIADAHNKDHE